MQPRESFFDLQTFKNQRLQPEKMKTSIKRERERERDRRTLTEINAKEIEMAGIGA